KPRSASGRCSTPGRRSRRSGSKRGASRPGCGGWQWRCSYPLPVGERVVRAANRVRGRGSPPRPPLPPPPPPPPPAGGGGGWRLPEDDWPFAPLAAVLRSTYFRPGWPEVQADPEVPAKAEALLRMLGETRGREAYLAAVREWEHTPPDPLEDKQAEEPRRKRV